MAVQYSLSYDADGNPSLVKNTIEGKAPVIKTDFTIGEYKPTRTIQEFANTASFDDLQAGKKSETINKALQNYIYQNNSNSDGDKDVESNKTFSQMDFDARVAKDPITGKVLGSPLTFIEKGKVFAQAFSEKKGAQTLLGLTDFGTVSGIINRVGKVPPGASITDPTGNGGGNIGVGNIPIPGEAGFASPNTQPPRSKQTQ